MSGPVLKAKLHFGRQGKGRKAVKDGERPVATGRGVPRVAKLMALAIRFDQTHPRRRRRRPSGTRPPGARHAGQGDADYGLALVGSRHPGGDPVVAGGGVGSRCDHGAGFEADCGGGGLGEAEGDVANRHCSRSRR